MKSETNNMAYRQDAPTIPFSDIEWNAIGANDPATRLLAHIRIGDLDMHLEAREVEYDDTGNQGTKEYGDDYDYLVAIADTAFSTTLIDGREYLLFATPYGL
jgi:hypothetical protein